MQKKRTNLPPRLASLLLERFMLTSIREGAVGDFNERYFQIAEDYGRFTARLWYWNQLLRAAPQHFLHLICWRLIMLKNYLKIAFRNAQKNKGYSLINIFGLAAGMTVFLGLVQLIRYELSYDGFYKDAHRIYRVTDRRSSRTQASLAAALTEMFPEVEKAGRIMYIDGFIRAGETLIQEQRIFFVDPAILDIFSISLENGFDRKMISDPHSILLTRSAADRYFGDADPVGKTLSFVNRVDLHVRGILDDPPENTHFRFEYITSMSTLKSIIGEDFFTGWGSREFFTYFKLAEKANPSALVNKFDALKEKYGLERPEYHLQPLQEIHLGGNLQADMIVNSNKKYVILLGLISVFILLMSSLNYINLSSARAAKRLKEIGLRKVVGSKRRDVFLQLLIESLLTSSLAMIISAGFITLLLPAMTKFWDRPLNFNVFHDSAAAGLVLGIPLAVGCLAGFFPALSMSSFSPMMMIRGKMTRKGNKHLRGGLIVFQFVITVFLIIGSFIIHDQLHFLTSKSSNAYGESIVLIKLTGKDIQQNHRPFKETLLNHPGILEATASFNLPFMITTGSWCTWPGQIEDERFVIRHSCVEPNFIEFYSINLHKGRNFFKGLSKNPENAVLINKTAARLIGEENIVGRTMSSSLFKDATIIGVLEDFHFKPLHQHIEPLALTLLQTDGHFAGAHYLAFKVNPQKIQSVLSFIKETWDTFEPAYPLIYDFMDEQIEALYRQELKIGEGIKILTSIEIFLACLGLFGLALFTIEQKTKEIGVRKVLGASVSGIVLMLFRELIRWIVSASLMAFPIAWFVMSRWLQNFEYHTEIKWLPFMVSTLLVLFVSLLSVGYHSIRAAKTNPADSLRYE
ncbi:MAG: ABC transporter permease [Candidatus Aminicenantes bacterium]|nr:ABC transporter permease [Candidatus Aminicenantes bacterium]